MPCVLGVPPSPRPPAKTCSSLQSQGHEEPPGDLSATERVAGGQPLREAGQSAQVAQVGAASGWRWGRGLWGLGDGLSVPCREAGGPLPGVVRTVCFSIRRSVTNVCRLRTPPRVGGRSVPERRLSVARAGNFPDSRFLPLPVRETLTARRTVCKPTLLWRRSSSPRPALPAPAPGGSSGCSEGRLKSRHPTASWALPGAFPALARSPRAGPLPTQTSSSPMFFLPVHRRRFPAALPRCLALSADAPAAGAAAGAGASPAAAHGGAVSAGNVLLVLRTWLSQRHFANALSSSRRPPPEEALKWGDSLEKLLLHKCKCSPGSSDSVCCLGKVQTRVWIKPGFPLVVPPGVWG